MKTYTEIEDFQNVWKSAVKAHYTTSGQIATVLISAVENLDIARFDKDGELEFLNKEELNALTEQLVQWGGEVKVDGKFVSEDWIRQVISTTLRANKIERRNKGAGRKDETNDTTLRILAYALNVSKDQADAKKNLHKAYRIVADAIKNGETVHVDQFEEKDELAAA